MDLIQPQLAQLQSQPPQGSDWIHEIKFDGYRTLAYIEPKVTLRTRSGLDWTEKYPSIAAALKKLHLRHSVFDGEICYVDEEGRSDFQKLQNSLKSGDTSHLVYFVFDLLEHRGKDLRDLTQIERKERLREVLRQAPAEVRYADHWSVDPSQLLSASCRLGLELKRDASRGRGNRSAPRKATSQPHSRMGARGSVGYPEQRETNDHRPSSKRKERGG